MAGNSAEMKVKATMDNSDLKKKAKESKDALKDFAKIGEDAVSSLGSAFGINVDQIKQMSSAIEGLGIRLESTGNKGAASFGKMLTSVSGFAAAVVALPLAGAIAGFKALNSEAEAFKNTVAGANIEMATSAYIDTYKQFLVDARQTTGKMAAQDISSLSKEWARIKADIKGIAMSGFFGAGVGNYNTEALLQFRKTSQEAEAAAEKAEKYQKRIYTIQRLISNSSEDWARKEREIAEYKRIAYDKTVDTVVRQEALNKVNDLIRTRYEDEIVLRDRLAKMQEKLNGLVSSSVADIDKATQLKIQADNAAAAMNNKLRETGELQATLTDQANKEAQARQEALAAAQQMAALWQSMAEWDGTVSGNLTAALPTTLSAYDPGIAVPVRPVLDTDAVTDLTNELESILTSSFQSIGSNLGALIGDLATGEDAWGNFANSAISAFGDLAISVGNIAISAGVTALAIQGALESLNGYAAIAAGIALVALGTAVKTGLSNIASGNYSSSNSVATSGYGSSSVSNAFETREVEVSVKGTLYASGNQLLAVIENENNRKNHTT